MDLNPQPFSTRLKVVSFAILILLFLLVAPARWFGVGKQTYQKSELSSSQADLAVQNINEDSDGDGIPNWKESLLGSDISVKNKVPISKESSAPTTDADRKATARLDDPKNLTSQFMKNTVGLSTYLNDQGVTDEATLTQVSKNITEQTENLIEIKTYTRNDLKITNDENLATMKLYGNNMGAILVNTFGRLDMPNMLVDLEKYTTTKNPADLQIYEKKSVSLNAILKDLTMITVPNSAVETHLYFTNVIERYRVVLDGIASGEQDPMRGLVAVNTYKDTYVDFSNSVNNLANYFSQKSAIFTKDERGYIFTKLILSK